MRAPDKYLAELLEASRLIADAANQEVEEIEAVIEYYRQTMARKTREYYSLLATIK